MAPVVDLHSFTRKLPKIELHAHLSGSISRECLHRIWCEKKSSQPELELEDPLIAIPPGKVDYDLDTFFPLFQNYIYKLCSDIPSIRASTLSVLADFEADNVIHLELRTTPREIQQYTISKRRYVETVLSAIEEYERDAGHRMKTRLILSVDRRNTFEQAQETVALAVDLRSRGVVGVDLCGDPSVVPVDHLAPAFVQAKLAGLKITLHFAENKASSTNAELATLLSWQPDRLGHVIHVNDAFKQIIVAKDIGVELCISCNVHAKMISGSFSDHHFGWWQLHHPKIALCTDDVGVFGSMVSNEYFVASQYFNLGPAKLKMIAEGVIDMIFAEDEEKARLRRIYADFKHDALTIDTSD